ncbi:hypothetical protein HHL11_04630 [Ramlibacter sp. G-1-2-2]|uniref:Uncharacterized protein n=1 Tax=Ramlibacter agri TaxID=2728837 RepID=A0A848GWJ4_9BURK|nr:hypothetical protein [Ramlibacter agri]NML43026.1 hypothetical protein [Ramlibacter agri]
MNRWIKLAFAGLSLATAAFVASAQGIVREAPRDVKPAIMVVSATPPIITVDGKDDRFSPGVRIRDLNNMLVLTGTLAGKTIYTVYRRDGAGLVHEVWLLTADEYAKVGGVSTGDPNGIKRFYELLDLIWSARLLLLK